MGVTFDDAALSNLGDAMSMVVLPLPHVAGLPFVTAVINSNPHGHPPKAIYDAPHFDVHFYSIDETTRLAVAPNRPEAAVTPVPSLVRTGTLSIAAA